MPTLNWIGKEAVTAYHNEVPFRTLEKQYVFNAEDSDNMIIHGDNLEALKALLPKYGGQVKCIYIDPPYNTGNSPDKGGWIYYDNVDSPKIRKWLGEVVGKEAEDFSRHDKWLCMMYPRLKLLQMLLAKDGAIFISIDDNEQANLKLICDEIFGARNFIDCLHWKRKKQPSFLAKHTAKVMEYVLVYAKERDSLEKLSIETLSDATKKVVNLTNQESVRHFGKGVRVKCGEKGIIPKGKYTIKTMSVEYLNDVFFENGVTTNEVDVKALFSVSQEKIDNFIAQHLLFITANFGLRRDVSEEEKTNKKAITDLLLDWGDNQDSEKELKEIFNRKSFDYSKPSKLIENIVKTISNADSVVLDSFAGSGTTAHAVLNLNKQDGGNRKFILVEMEDYADNITAERVRRVINGYGNATKAVEGTGGDFAFYELGQPLFNEDGNLNEAVGSEKIREYIWYSETHAPYTKHDGYLLGTHNTADYYFFYDPDKFTTLCHDTLNIVTQQAEQYIIYADICTLSQEELTDLHIIFKKIPRDINRF